MPVSVFGAAIKTIIVADLVMSLDNVIAIAGAGRTGTCRCIRWRL